MEQILSQARPGWTTLFTRQRVANYWNTVMLPHLRRHGWLWGGLVAGLVAFNAFCTLVITITPSLPYSVFVVVKGDFADMQRGDFVAWRWAGGATYPAGAQFVKQVRGLPGDSVTTRSRDIYINGEYVSSAKLRSMKGEPLALGPSGVIPPRHFYAYAPHPDALDSRFAVVGWPSHDQVVGRAIPIF